MSIAETLTLAAYFFVLIILAIYGWHRYYLVYLYMRNKDKRAEGRPAARSAAGRHDSAAALQRDVRRRPADRRGLRESTTRASCSKSRCSTTRPTRPAVSPTRRSAASPPRASTSSTSTAPTAPATRPARSKAGLKTARGEFIAIFDADFIPTADFLTRLMPHFTDATDRDGAGALGPHQPRLLAADQDPGDPARRALRARARRPQSRRPVLQLQRHRRRLAPRARSTTPAAGSTTR